MGVHLRRHPRYVEGCFGCKVVTLHIAPAAMASRIEGDRDYGYQRRFARENTEDREAYRRLRRDGLQPPHIAGSAHLERNATLPFEVAQGRVYEGKQKRQLREALAITSDGGMDVTAPATNPWEGD